MKIERISENQIKFTLNRMDLASHQLKISELAYGTEKTKGLLQDMMEQASDELGFEVNDTPLMIEAIPVSMDCIVLMVTRVDEPDEVDTKFSGFTNLRDLLADDAGESEPQTPASKAGAPAPKEEIPARVQEMFANRRSPNGRAAAVMERLYSFEDLETVIDFSRQAEGMFSGESSLYSSPDNGKYYLLLKNSSADIKAFSQVCSCALEYGSKEACSLGRSAYINEHFRCIIKNRAIRSLSNL